MASDDQCAIHGYEPITANSYRLCVECGHCYQTEQELVDEDVKIRERMGDTNVVAMRPEDIVICPLCTHDF